MPHESLTQMAKAKENPKKKERSQAELRHIMEEKLQSYKPTLLAYSAEYKQALKDKLFEDKEEEEPGAGEERKEAMQKKINSLLDRAEKLKVKLDSKEPLTQSSPEISATYTRPDGTTETLSLDIEQKLQEFTDFYQTTNLPLPPDFEAVTMDIWERNRDKIEEAMEQNGFDSMLIIPPTTNLKDLADKMKMESGYYFYQVKNDFSDIKSQNTDKPRLILYHKQNSLPDINTKTGLPIHLNITGADASALYRQNPDHYLSTLEDAIVLERYHLEKTGKHISDYKTKSATWLPGSSAGARLLYSDWYPGARKLDVVAGDPGGRDGHLGARPTRCFY